jgi:hypothetical protein
MINAIHVRNVQQALPEGCYQMTRLGVERDSRNGKVLVMPGTTVTEYASPAERVLTDPDRDANPFFHFMEALWMLDGRRDVEFPAFFNAGMAQYSDDGVVFNAAYGYRWRHHFALDQLHSIATALRANPECRRQVLAIWDGRHDLGRETKDTPCNLTVTFQVGPDGRLDMVVFNRSNDLIWGAYGANAVHFSMLHEFMSAWVGVPQGTYSQVSANTHVYEPHWELMRKLADRAPMPPQVRTCDYSRGEVATFPMVNLPINRWRRELSTFLKLSHRDEYVDPFFQEVAKPIWNSWVAMKERTNPSRYTNARRALVGCLAHDWALACREWIDRRERRAAILRGAEAAQ